MSGGPSTVHTYVSPFDRAIINIGLGDNEKALIDLERAVDDNSSGSIYDGAEPRLDPIRQEPRWRLPFDSLETSNSLRAFDPWLACLRGIAATAGNLRMQEARWLANRSSPKASEGW